MSQLLSFINPDEKSYLKRENRGLYAILDKLLQWWIISQEQYDINTREVDSWKPISPAYDTQTREEQLHILEKLWSIIGNEPITQEELPGWNTLLIKDLSVNPFGSHYDRVLYWMLQKLLEKKPLEKVIEISSGSLWISLAGIVSYLLGKEVQLICPESKFPIRYSLAQRLGAKVTLTDEDSWVWWAGLYYKGNLRKFIKERLTPLNHSHSHWDAIAPEVRKIWLDIWKKIDIALLIKWNGTTALGIWEWIQSVNPNAEIIGVRYGWGVWGEMTVPWNDHTSIQFPLLQEFEERFPGEIIVDLELARQLGREKEIGLSSAVVRQAVDDLILERGFENKKIAIMKYDSNKRY